MFPLTHAKSWARGVSICLLLILVSALTACSGWLEHEDYQDGLRRYGNAIGWLRAAETPRARWGELGNAAKESFEQGKYDDARKYALELRQRTPAYTDDFYYCDAIQRYNLVLGRLAVRDGDLQAAEKYLMASARMPDVDYRSYFGPNVSLANDLLSLGHREVVVRYLKATKKFWVSSTPDQVDIWVKEIKSGKYPDFGANLVY